MSERKTAEEMAREALRPLVGQHNGRTVDVADVVALMERYAAQEVAAARGADVGARWDAFKCPTHEVIPTLRYCRVHGTHHNACCWDDGACRTQWDDRAPER